MNASDIVMILREVAPILLGIATLVTAIGALRQGKRTRAAVIDNTDLTIASKVSADAKLNQIHTMVNDATTRGLGREAGQAERIADLTGDPRDVQLATQARDEYSMKKATDTRVDRL